MTPKELSEIIEALILEAEEKFQAGTEAAQVNLWRVLSGVIDGVDVDAAGNIKRTGKNLSRLNGIDRRVEETVVTAAYYKRVAAVVSKFDTLRGLVDKYLKDEIGADAKKSLFDFIRKGAADRTISSLTGAGIDTNLTEPLKELLRVNITSGGNFFDLKQKVKEFITGDAERLGRLRSYSGQITRDALNQFSANYTQAVSADLGLEWYYYSSGTVKDSRPFCVERAGRYFHKSEVESWASQKWAGKIAETTAATIFTYRGGWNCMHTLIPVSERRVPKDVLERVRGKAPEPVIEAAKGTDGKAPDGFQFMPDMPKEVRDKLTFSGKRKEVPDGFNELGTTFPDEFWEMMPKKTKLTTKKKGSYCEASGETVNIELGNRWEGSEYYKRKVISHEYGHAWHNLTGYIKEAKFGSQSISATNEDFKALFSEFKSAMKSRFGDIDNWDVKLRTWLVDDLGEKILIDGEKVNLRDFLIEKFGIEDEVEEMINSVADTIAALTKGEAGWGHSKAYFRLPGMNYAEFFAHLNENFWVGNPVFKEFYPDLYELGIEFMKNLYGF